ncbi:MAG: HPr kinase/phosphatase C-terminal domain-containing protein [Alphaproteobacteria bacterium]|nr:HPr kinase/phosphatase C-terminal domain-containing protein [Alphaproteobacteria bacterium]
MTKENQTQLLHASCVALNGRGVLLAGPSGIGKSDLALRLIHRGAMLVADDCVEIKKEQSTLYVSAPAQLAGLIEARHVGLLRLPYLVRVPLVLYVDLCKDDKKLERLPILSTQALLGCDIRSLTLPACAASSEAKIALVLQGDLLNV